jgi:hypothetical protein
MLNTAFGHLNKVLGLSFRAHPDPARSPGSGSPYPRQSPLIIVE